MKNLQLFDSLPRLIILVNLLKNVMFCAKKIFRGNPNYGQEVKIGHQVNFNFWYVGPTRVSLMVSTQCSNLTLLPYSGTLLAPISSLCLLTLVAQPSRRGREGNLPALPNLILPILLIFLQRNPKKC